MADFPLGRGMRVFLSFRSYTCHPVGRMTILHPICFPRPLNHVFSWSGVVLLRSAYGLHLSYRRDGPEGAKLD